jgi:tetratricopeptide (TPR) repeat protein
MKPISLLLMVTLYASKLVAQQGNAEINKGNEAYRLKEYQKAGSFYRKALEKQPDNDIARFNLANSFYRDGEADEAIELFSKVAGGQGKAEARSHAHFNKGVVLTNQKKLKESINAYKDALRLNPTDSLARDNLQRALNELSKQQQQQNKKNQQPQKKPEKLNKQQVMQMLNALQEQEKLLQQKMNKSKVPGPAQPEKDW